MYKLENLASLKRLMRQDIPVSDLGKPTWDLAIDAFKAGKVEEAIRLMDYARKEGTEIHDVMVSNYEVCLTYMANELGEEALPRFFRQEYEPRTKQVLATQTSVLERLYKCTEQYRGHWSQFSVTEEPDKYIVRQYPCSTGGKLRTKRPVGLTKKAYPWSWGKAGVPYYCTHCCMAWEIIAIELTGAPIIVKFVNEKPGDPCTCFFYKKPELVPEEYFTRVGKEKNL